MKVKQPKPDPELKAAQTRSANSAAEQAQKVSAEKANEAIRLSRQGRKQLMFSGTNALGVSSKMGPG